MRLKGKTILITASGQGIGRASALACAAEGATVIATDRDPALLAGLDMETHALDVTNPASITALRDRLPPLDGLFNCAGYVANGTILDVTEKDWDFSFDLNVKSMFHTCRAFLPGLLDQARFAMIERPIAVEEKAARNLDTVSRGMLKSLTAAVQNASWTRDDLEEAAQQVAMENGVGLGKIAAPLRAALAGTSATPSVFDMMTALGRDETLARLQDQTDLAG